MTTEADNRFMQQALALAEAARFITHPNPNVGCVIVNNGEVVGQGATARVGGPHAEVHALQQAQGAADGATAYVTLEPCSHFGRTPPCAKALIDAGVKRVVAAILDPNPQVAGKGLQMLADAGVQTEHGLCSDEARWQLRGFLSRMERKRPWVRAKVATSADGRTAMANGESQWITGAEARRDGQFMRAESDCVLTGIGTVLDDNPSLNVRLSAEELNIDAPVRQPLRALMDTQGRLPTDSQWLATPGDKCIYTTAHKEWEGGQTVQMDSSVRLSPAAVLSDLAQREVNFVHLEAGAVLLGSFLKAGLVDELVMYIAPAFLGSEGRPMANIEGLVHISDAMRWRYADVRVVGSDLRVGLVPV